MMSCVLGNGLKVSYTCIFAEFLCSIDELQKLARDGHGVFVDKETMAKDLVLPPRNCFSAFVKNDTNILEGKFFEEVRDKECTRDLYTENYDRPQDDNMKKVAMKYSMHKDLLRFSPCNTETESK